MVTHKQRVERLKEVYLMLEDLISKIEKKYGIKRITALHYLDHAHRRVRLLREK